MSSAMPPRQRAAVQISVGPPVALYVLVGINAVVYFAWQSVISGDGQGSGFRFMAENFLVSSHHVSAGHVWTLVTSAFSHTDSAHILFNMLALLVFGREVETLVGRRDFVLLYLAGGVVASLGHVGYMIATGSQAPALGASGSVMAIAVVFAFLFPMRKLLLFFIVPLPAAVAVAGYIVVDLFGVFATGSGIAHAAHLGGAALGALFYRFRVRPNLGARIRELVRAAREQRR